MDAFNIELNKSICTYIVDWYKTKTSKTNPYAVKQGNTLGCYVHELLNFRNKDFNVCVGTEDDYVYIAVSSPELFAPYIISSEDSEDLPELDEQAWIMAYPIINETIFSLYFIKELYDNKLIYANKLGDDEIDGVTGGPQISIPHFFKDAEMINFLKASYYAEIIPSPYLIELVANGFLSKEDIQYREQLQISNKALEIAEQSLKESRKSQKWTIIISITICILSVLASLAIAKYIPLALDDNSIEKIENVIYDNYNNGKTQNAKP